VANFATTFLLILAILNVIATISLWENWLDVMGNNWAFNAFFAHEAKADIRSEIATAVLGSLVPAGLAFVASARRWKQVHLVHALCGAWLLAYLFLRVPGLQTMFKQPFFDMQFGVGMWFRFHGFPAGTLIFTLILLATVVIGYTRQKR
jgi:hypothetical protein